MRVVDVVQAIITIFFYEIGRELYHKIKLDLEISNGTAYRVVDDKSKIVIHGSKEFIEKMKEKYPNGK